MIQIPGKLTVPTPGTPVQIFAALNAADPTTYKFKKVQAVLLQALFGNTGKVYVGAATMNKASLAFCSAVLAIPTAAGAQSWGAANPLTPAGVDLDLLYLDVDVANEGVLVTLLVS